MGRFATSKVVTMQVDQFIQQNGLNPTPAQRKAMIAILDQNEVLALSGCGTGKTTLFQMCEDFLRRKGGQLRYERTLEK